MGSIKKCPLCGGCLLEKKVEKLLRGGYNIAIIKVNALVCSHCGEKIYPENIVRKFEEIRRKLINKDISDFRVIGKSFEVNI